MRHISITLLIASSELPLLSYYPSVTLPKLGAAWHCNPAAPAAWHSASMTVKPMPRDVVEE